MSKGRRALRRFHGRDVRFSRKVTFHPPEQLIVLGRAVAVEYECDKWNGGGDGTVAVYRHEFEEPAVLCMDERGKKQLYIMGPEIVVTRAGIEN